MSHAYQSRSRPDPTKRFSAREHLIDLRKLKETLLSESSGSGRGHRHETLFKTRTLTIATFVFEKDGVLKDHLAKGVVVIQVIEGRLSIKTETQTYEIKPGEILVLAPNVPHSVSALESSQMLLTVDLAD